MTKKPWDGVGAGMMIAGFCVVVGVAPTTSAQTPPAATPNLIQKEQSTMTTTAMPLRASGSFDVKLNPLPTDGANKAESGAAALGRMSIDKQFHGELEATSKGEMLTAMTAVKGSAGYVAIERVSGTLGGRSGGFTLQHTGTMTRGAPELLITVVPDSGTGQLAGLSGKMTIRIEEGGKHFYDFEYSLAAEAR